MSGAPYWVQSHHFSHTEQVFANSRTEHDKHFICDVAGCARPFKRRGDLRRHSKIHDAKQMYDCPAVDCGRTGERGFVRRDKLVDHMLAGHDEHALFSCLACEKKLSRDLLAVHEGFHSDHILNCYRTCPLRCSFKVNVPEAWSMAKSTATSKKMDKLQHHFLGKHDLKERMQYTNLFEQRGYDARTCEVVCPLCTPKCRFPGHFEFFEHFMQAHFLGPTCNEHADRSCSEECPYRSLYWRLEHWRKHKLRTNTQNCTAMLANLVQD
jgi:hypothetical protein